MDREKEKALTKWVGNRLVGVAWASDFKWDWVSDNGDKHTDYISISRCTRGEMSFLRLTLGPLMLCLSSPVKPGCGAGRK